MKKPVLAELVLDPGADTMMAFGEENDELFGCRALSTDELTRVVEIYNAVVDLVKGGSVGLPHEITAKLLTFDIESLSKAVVGEEQEIQATFHESN